MYCKNCGVELENDMPECPLCGEVANSNQNTREKHSSYGEGLHLPYKEMSKPQKKFTWEIISLILLSGAITTFIVDFIMNRGITWSELPVAICMSIFCYVSLFTFWHNTTLLKISGGLLLSTCCFLALDALTAGIQWALKLGIPLLFAANLVTAAWIAVMHKAKYKGVNLIAYALLGTALLCIAIEASVSHFKTGAIQMQWSAIVTISLIPVIIVLLFVHFRLRKGRNLERTFHI